MLHGVVYTQQWVLLFYVIYKCKLDRFIIAEEKKTKTLEFCAVVYVFTYDTLVFEFMQISLVYCPLLQI